MNNGKSYTFWLHKLFTYSIISYKLIVLYLKLIHNVVVLKFIHAKSKAVYETEYESFLYKQRAAQTFICRADMAMNFIHFITQAYLWKQCFTNLHRKQLLICWKWKLLSSFIAKIPVKWTEKKIAKTFTVWILNRLILKINKYQENAKYEMRYYVVFRSIYIILWSKSPSIKINIQTFQNAHISGYFNGLKYVQTNRSNKSRIKIFVRKS